MIQPEIINGLCGAVGSLCRTLNFVMENGIDKTEKILIFRNVLLGFMSGALIGVTPATAFFAGLGGEYIISEGAKKV